MTQRGNDRVAARQRARQRRLKLDADRIAREERVDAAVAEFDLARAACDEARQALETAELALGRAVAAVLSEGEPVERVAALCELSASEVRRLSKLEGDQLTTRRGPARSRAGSTSAPADGSGGSPDGTAEVARLA